MTFVPCSTDGAQDLVDQNFDERAAMQRDAFLQPGQHEEAKYHGKLRTKFSRMALSLHALQALCAAWRQSADANDVTDTWGMDFQVATQIPKTVFQFAYALCDYAEVVWQLLDFARKGHSLPPDPARGVSRHTHTQAACATQAKSCDFKALMRAVRGSQQGPSNDELDALNDLGAALPLTLLVFLQRLPLQGGVASEADAPRSEQRWCMVLLESIRGRKKKGEKVEGSR